MELYEKNGNILYILNILKKYSDMNHMLSAAEIERKVLEIYNVKIDPRTIRRNINLLKHKLNYDISTREENGKGYYINNDPFTDFEPGEIRAIIDTFSYANYIVPSIGKAVIKKCKNLQNIYENEKLKNYKIYANNSKTDNIEVIKNIEDISEAIYYNCKISFDYLKYDIIDDKLKKIVVSSPKVAPYAIVYNEQQFYLIGIKEGNSDFYYFRLDRIKNIKILEEKRNIIKSENDIQEYAESTVLMFGGKKEEIEVIFNKFLLDSVIEKFGRNITLEKIPEDKENYRLIVNTNLMGVKMWAMRNIDMVEVIRPLSLRNEIKEIINNASKRYNK